VSLGGMGGYGFGSKTFLGRLSCDRAHPCFGCRSVYDSQTRFSSSFFFYNYILCTNMAAIAMQQLRAKVYFVAGLMAFLLASDTAAQCNQPSFNTFNPALYQKVAKQHGDEACVSFPTLFPALPFSHFNIHFVQTCLHILEC
jgi:hypothetical protein